MNEDRPGPIPETAGQAEASARVAAGPDPHHLAGQNIGQQSDAQVEAEWTAFHLRKCGLDLGGVKRVRPSSGGP
jgi:hypothetical protein